METPSVTATWIEEVESAMPLLPMALVPLPAYQYEGKKFMGKGPQTDLVAFIMTAPWIERDLSSADFMKTLQCTCRPATLS